MIEINGVLISEAITKEKFVCNLDACKGACCWEGDYGAPLEQPEIKAIDDHKEAYIPYLSDASRQVIEDGKAFTFYEDAEQWGTTCHEDGSCASLSKSTHGFATCSIETAYMAGTSPVNKPISCHLYPIRVTKYEEQGFEAWNYDEWDICSAACTLGNKLNVPIYQFLKDAIKRYKGDAFYDQLDHAAQHLDHSEQ